MKILLLGEYSGLNNELKKALLDCGHDVTLAASNDFLKKYPSDINLGYGNHILSYKIRQILLPLFHINKLTGYDIVHVINFYIFPRLPFLNLFLIKFLKNNNGIITLSGAGDDPFFVKYSEETMRYSPIPSHELYDRGGKEYYMRRASHYRVYKEYMLYIDSVIPIMYEYYSTFHAAGYGHKTISPIPIPIDCDRFQYRENIVKNNKIIYFHGLNRRGFKGTYIIEDAFRTFSERYPKDVECIIDGNMSFNKYMDLVSEMNVTLDQVFSYSLSMNSLYSMAQGKIVCGGAEVESGILYENNLPPIYNLLPSRDQILSVMEEILSDKNRLGETAEKGRAFVMQYHAPRRVAELYIAHWESLM